MSAHAAFIRVGPGGICFAHGPYSEQQCPRFPDCATDPQHEVYKTLVQPKSMRTSDTQVIIAQLYTLIGQLQTLINRMPAD